MATLYEHKTAETIRKDILALVSNKLDKRIGSISYDAAAPAAVEMAYLYRAIEYGLDQAFADTAERVYLIRRAREKGLEPKPATYARVQGVFTPEDLEIPVGSRFTCNEYNYAVTGMISAGRYYLECETIGSEANGNTGRLIPIQTITGLRTAELVEVSIPGEDEEDTEVFRQRYYDSTKSETYGGNVAEYKSKILSLPGVGGVKVFPAWNGGGTVRCVLIDSDYGVPTNTLVSEVQEAIDPLFLNGEETQGLGLGIAPIGHFVTIQGANAETVNITSRLSYQAGYTFETVRERVEAVLAEYCDELNQQWQSQTVTVVRLSEINARILMNVPGVVDIVGTMINGVPDNLVLQSDSIVEAGTFTATA